MCVRSDRPCRHRNSKRTTRCWWLGRCSRCLTGDAQEAGLARVDAAACARRGELPSLTRHCCPGAPLQSQRNAVHSDPWPHLVSPGLACRASPAHVDARIGPCVLVQAQTSVATSTSTSSDMILKLPACLAAVYAPDRPQVCSVHSECVVCVLVCTCPRTVDGWTVAAMQWACCASRVMVMH
jgi:hypothetical protein